MRTLVLLIIGAVLANAQIDAASTGTLLEHLPSVPATEVERGAHHRIFERVRLEPNGLGRTVPRTTRYIELSTGGRYQENGIWLATQELIELELTGGAVARRGPHKVTLPVDVASPLSILTPDNKTIRWRILGLAYFDYQSKQHVVIAELKNSIGVLAAANQVVYQNAFTDFHVDVRYIYTKAGLEQDLILRERPALLPEDFGLNPDSTRLQVWTEFLEAPEPIRHQRVKKRWLQAKEDHLIDFGEMKIGYGTAFAIPGESKAQGMTMDKEWAVIDGRNFLIEDIGFRWIKPHLRALEAADQAGLKKKSPDGVLYVVSTNRLVPAKKLASVNSTNQIQMARLSVDEPGLVLDWGLVTTQTNTFYPDMTYCVEGQVNLEGDPVTGNVTFHGGSVIKFKPGGQLNILGNLRCNTDAYHPVTFTASSDNTLGEEVDPGSPTEQHAEIALSLQNGGELKHLRFLYAKTAIRSVQNYTVKHSQFVHCGWGLHTENAFVTARNILMTDVGTNFFGWFYHGTAQHLTSHQATKLTDDPAFQYYGTEECPGPPSSSVTLVNSLLVEMGDYGVVPVYSDHVATPTMAAFQSAVGGSLYLHDDDVSTYRNTGTINIDAGLREELKTMTTHRPVVYVDHTFETPMTFEPRPIRDVDTPDYGFHAVALDYAFGGCHADENVIFQAGTAAGWFRTSSGWEHAGHGIHIADQKIVKFEGRADAPAYWVRCNTVQEGGNGVYEGGYGPGGITGWADQNLENVNLSPEIHARFTKFSVLAGEAGNHFRDDWGYLIVRARDCEFRGAGVGGYVISCYLTNCLMEYTFGAQVAGLPGNEYHVRNCTWIGSRFILERWYSPIPVSIQDCAFEGTTFEVNDGQANAEYDHNAFLTGASTPGGTENVTVSSFNWRNGTYGSYYLLSGSPLIDSGAVSAASRGLFHYASTVANDKEGNSIVNRGFH